MPLPSVTRAAGALCAATLTLTTSACVTIEQSRPGASPKTPDASRTSTTDDAPSPSATSTELPDAATLVSDAQDALKAAKRLTYRQKLIDKGQTVTMTTRGSVNGEPTEQTAVDPSHGTVTYRHVGSQLFIKGDAKNWAGDPYALDHFVGRWVRALPGKKAQGIIADMSMQPNIKDVLDDSGFMAAYLSSTATVKRDTLPGVGDTYRVTGDDGSRIWITADGRHHIVRISGYRFEDGTKGDDTLSGYDDAYGDVTAPADPVQMPNDYDADGGASPRDDDSPRATT